mmetsp:Transcript_24976/g.22155  ORF Transcript_24976/g.22155 Transcript_24976/m.22155 type:complete len:83 (+) Transcript_24976:127-375(+)
MKSSTMYSHEFSHFESQKFRPMSNAITSTKASTSHHFRPKVMSSMVKARTERRGKRHGTASYLIKRNFIRPQKLRNIASSGL